MDHNLDVKKIALENTKSWAVLIERSSKYFSAILKKNMFASNFS